MADLSIDHVEGWVWGPGKADVLRAEGASIYVGDHVHDVEGARAAGVLSVSVLTGGCTRAELEAAVAAACAGDPWLARHPVVVQWWGGQFAPGQVEQTAAVTRLVSAAHTEVHGARPAVHGVPYGSDQRLLTGIGGIPIATPADYAGALARLVPGAATEVRIVRHGEALTVTATPSPRVAGEVPSGSA